MCESESEEKVSLYRCEHNEILVSIVSDRMELWAMSHRELYPDKEVCRPEIYEIPVSALKNELDLEEYKTDF